VLAIDVSGLRKAYGSIEAVRGVSFQVEAGQVFALLGPNGAGKTTTLEILEGFRDRTAGSVSVLGLDPADHAPRLRQQIGIVLQGAVIEPYLTCREVLRRNAGYYPEPRDVNEVIELVGLEEKADVRVKTLSGGQQRRLDMALGIIGDPALLFLDEPTTGFDPSARRGAWDVVRNLAGAGTTILLTTQNLADHVAVINRGVIVAEGTPETIGGRADAAVRIRFVLPAGMTLADLPVGGTVDGHGNVEVLTEEEVKVLHELTGWALDHQVPLEGLSVDRPSLEDIYLALTDDEEAS
jgi:ABC-2 type transport system ATP-binding protein